MPAFNLPPPLPHSVYRRARPTCSLLPPNQKSTASSALDDIEPSFKLNAVAEALARSGDHDGTMRVISEMNSANIPLGTPTLTSIIDSVVPNHQALQSIFRLVPPPGYATITLPPPSQPLPSSPDPTRLKDLSFAGAFLTILSTSLSVELLEPAVFHHPAPEATTTLVLLASAMVFDRYASNASLWSTISLGLRRIFSEDPVRSARIDAAYFMLAYLMGLPWVCFQPDTAQILSHHGAARVPTHSGVSEKSAKSRRPFIDDATIDLYLVWLVAGVAAESIMDGLLIRSDFANARLLLRRSRSSADTTVRIKDIDRRVRMAFSVAEQLLRRHSKLHDRLSEGMLQGFSVGQCVALMIEEFDS